MINNTHEIKFIDLFAGMGGLRLGFEKSFNNVGVKTKCVMTSEIKPYAVKVLEHNFEHENIVGDITRVDIDSIPDFDFLLGGFPCQPFSASGKRQGFVDTRGTLFFDIERILTQKMPYGFILENVEGLVKHDLENKNDEIGNTLSVILKKLTSLGYNVSWKVLNSADFGLPQARKRIYIVGTLGSKVDLNNFPKKKAKVSDILEKGLPILDTKFTKLLLGSFSMNDLYGKSIKDKRGGNNNIHSWDLNLKGPVSEEQSILLNQLFKERRKKHWAEQIGIKWMDGMCLTFEQISTFNTSPNLKEMLDDLVKKGYLKYEHPKSLVVEKTIFGDKSYRLENKSLKAGYNIVSGKLSFEINKILDPNDVAPTLVATDIQKLAVPDGDGVRKITLREGLRLFGYPEWYELPVKVEEGFDLLGNTVAINVVSAVVDRIAHVYEPQLQNC